MEQHRIPIPMAQLSNYAEAIKGTANIQSLAFTDEPSRTKLRPLPPDAKHERVRLVIDIKERLVEIGHIFIRGPGTAIATAFESALKLREQTEVRAEVPIAVKQITPQNISTWAGWIGAESRLS
jgi:hypothetical protein